jgi:hypothetical protein
VRYVDLWRTTGQIVPKKFGGHKKHKLAEYADKVKELVVSPYHPSGQNQKLLTQVLQKV